LKSAVYNVEDPSDNVHLIKHYYDVWIVVVSLVTVYVWELPLVITAWGQSDVSASFLIEQLKKSHVVRGNVNN
jgi:hypothetical protein